MLSSCEGVLPIASFHPGEKLPAPTLACQSWLSPLLVDYTDSRISVSREVVFDFDLGLVLIPLNGISFS